ncbi:MAG: PilZ domain-containing protein [Xanthobacteraceae bacterium]
MARTKSESRNSKRHLVLHGARIADIDGSALESCRILDVSGSGARLQVTDPGHLPDQFLLLLSRDGALRRQCAVVWRSERTIGVEFVR